MNLLKMLKVLFTSAPRHAPSDCAARVRSGLAHLVDVREPGEWASGVAQTAKLLPLSDLTGARTQWNPFLIEANGREILLYCASGTRSGLAARVLASEGFRAANTGGLSGWLAAGWNKAKPPRARGR